MALLTYPGIEKVVTRLESSILFGFIPVSLHLASIAVCVARFYAISMQMIVELIGLIVRWGSKRCIAV